MANKQYKYIKNIITYLVQLTEKKLICSLKYQLSNPISRKLNDAVLTSNRYMTLNRFLLVFISDIEHC